MNTVHRILPLPHPAAGSPESVVRGEWMLKGCRVGEEMLKEGHAGETDVERASCWGIDG